MLVWMPAWWDRADDLRGITSYAPATISWVSGKVVMTMRRRLFGHMMGMPVSFFDKQSTGTLLSRITYDSEQVASSSSGALITVVREGASIIGLFIMMFYYSWQLSSGYHFDCAGTDCFDCDSRCIEAFSQHQVKTCRTPWGR
ncbi:ABC transporter transmembrane domain-containing protein [Escherichia coli]